MKVSCLPVSLFSDILNGSMTIKDWARIAKECGLDAIDLSMIFIKNHTTRYLSQIKKDIENENMSVAMITTYPDFSNPDTLQVEREMEYLRNDIAVASFLEARFLRILAGQNYPGIDKNLTINKIIDCFKRISSVADKYNIKLVYENHSKPGVWDYSDFSHPTEIFLKIVEGIRDTNIGINFDTANTIILGDNPIELLKKIIKKVSVIHAADALGVGELKPASIGKGIAPFKDIFRFLKEVNFNGWICIEEASDNGIKGIKSAADFIKRKWAAS